MKPIEQLQSQCRAILKQFANVGDFRPGSLSENYQSAAGLHAAAHEKMILAIRPGC